MARTKSSVGVKMSSAKSSKIRAAAAPTTPKAVTSKRSSTRAGKNPFAGANPVQFWETPAWQKPITDFFGKNAASQSNNGEGSSKDRTPQKSSTNEDSDDETSAVPSRLEKPFRLRILDDSAEAEELPELDGEDSHKIAEYFSSVPVKEEANGQSDEENRIPNKSDDKKLQKTTEKTSGKRPSDVLDKDSSPRVYKNKKVKIDT